MEEQNKKNPNKKAWEVVQAYNNSPASKACDPQGSYTGRPEDKNEVPVQDADDL